jgi:hypothetical protein
VHIDGLGKHIDQLGDGQDAPAAAPFQPQSPGLQQGYDPSHESESETQGALKNEPHIADLKAIARDIYGYDQNVLHHDTSLPSKQSIRENGFKRMPAPLPDGVSGNNNLSQLVETHEQDPAHATRNELFKTRWGQIKKSWESPEIDVDKMDELHKFEQLADKASFETIQNIADLMAFMHMMKNNRAVQKTGTFVEQTSSGLIKKQTVEKYIRTIPHIFHAMSLSLDLDTKKITEGAFRLAFTPNLVDGDEAAGKEGLETKEVRLIRDAIRRTLQKSGFNPNTGELVDKDRLKSIDEARKAAEQRQKEFFLNGLDALSVKKDSPRNGISRVLSRRVPDLTADTPTTPPASARLAIYRPAARRGP